MFVERRTGRQRLHRAAAFGAALGASVVICSKQLRAEFVESDVLVHQFWMRRWQDPGLFDDPLTTQLRASARYPGGYELLFRFASEVVDPVVFGKALGILLMAASAWLVYLIVLEHTSWWPAACIAAALFLALGDVHRFTGGFPRGFVHPAVLAVVLLAMKGHQLAAALVATAAAALYPPAALLAVGVLAVAAVGWHGRRPVLDRRRALFAVLAGAGALAFVLPQTVLGDSPEVITAAEARAYPEFQQHFFASSLIEYLRQNRSGFDLRAAGSLLALAAVALVAVRPANLRLLRREVLALPVVALAAFTVAQLVLFKLYLPHRYTYPLVAFFPIVVAVALRPTWAAIWNERGARLRAFAILCAPALLYFVAVHAFPLGPTRPVNEIFSAGTAMVVSAVVVLSILVARHLGRLEASPQRTAIGAALTGVMLVGLTVSLPTRELTGLRCPSGPVSRYLAGLPKRAVIAGDPARLACIPLTARRPVVISTKLALSYETEDFLGNRARMFQMIRAYYGPSARPLAQLGDRYGATHLWVQRDAVAAEMAHPKGVIWRGGRRPYSPVVKRLLRAGTPIVLRLPPACRRWHHGQNEVYAIDCIASHPSSSG